jgi:hypothetical protein
MLTFKNRKGGICLVGVEMREYFVLESASRRCVIKFGSLARSVGSKEEQNMQYLKGHQVVDSGLLCPDSECKHP